MILQLATSPDGQWAVARTGRQVQLLAAGAAPPLARIELDSDDADLAIVNGPPNVVIAAARDGSTTRITLHFPPELDTTARIDLSVAAMPLSARMRSRSAIARSTSAPCASSDGVMPCAAA